MRIGRFPGQEEALRRAREAQRRKERRRLLAVGLGALAGGIGLGLAGSKVAGDLLDPETVRRRRALEHARTLARGPLGDLVEGYAFVLDQIDLTGGDAILWTGVERLARWALRDDDPQARRIARELARTLRHGRAPRALRQLLPDLERR